MRVSDTNDKCFTCQIDDLRSAGIELTNQERNHSMMWGCTCEPEAAEDAIAYMNLVTR